MLAAGFSETGSIATGTLETLCEATVSQILMDMKQAASIDCSTV